MQLALQLNSSRLWARVVEELLESSLIALLELLLLLVVLVLELTDLLTAQMAAPIAGCSLWKRRASHITIDGF